MGIIAANSKPIPFSVKVTALLYRQLLSRCYTIYPSNPEESMILTLIYLALDHLMSVKRTNFVMP
jgi:hypothetical protein